MYSTIDIMGMKLCCNYAMLWISKSHTIIIMHDVTVITIVYFICMAKKQCLSDKWGFPKVIQHI